MRILFISMVLPFPPNFGKRMENWFFLRALAQEGHEATLISIVDPNEVPDKKALSEVCKSLETVELSSPHFGSVRGYIDRLAALFSGKAYSIARHSSDALNSTVKGCLDDNSYDLVICDEIFLFQSIPSSCPVPVAVKKDHVATVMLERMEEYARNPVTKVYLRLEKDFTARAEKTICGSASAIFACSEPERKFLETMCPGVPSLLIPNVVDVESYVPSPEGEPQTILFQGIMDWYPNQDAVTYFASEILPALRGLVPDIKLIVAGRSSSDQFQKRFSDRREIQFTGTVPEMRPVIARAEVCVVPLRIGSGTRFKILEAAAMGKPVVSTSLGAEGLEFADGEEIVIADNPGAFASAVADLLADPARRKRMGLAARRRVESLYSVKALQGMLRLALARFSNGAHG